ncbi:sentrin-specific protease 5 [Notolabrus celidotus]|uniref:sentrin-specific protease 5 n=1 Tax=Notolabrus celidotus TaxID=1203425 RepID=UPI00149086AB|nr:sentrin-specific protease 5 [Notolabrus celidotus]
MVHSGSASPMKTTPSASPHLTVSATAPSLVPLVPPPGDTTDLDLTPAPAKLLATDLTSNSDLTQPSTPTPADAEPPVVTPAQAITNSSPASARTLTQTQTPVRGLANGRTSGRKRTPKACDCCGPNGKGHNDGISGRGRGRGRGRARGKGRGTYGDEWDTPKRKVGSLLTKSNSLDLTNEKVEEAEEEVDKYEELQRTPVEADSQAQTPVALPVTLSQQVEPTRNFSAQVKVDAPKKEEFSKEGSGSAGAGGKAGGDSRDVEVRFSGVAGRGATGVRGRGWRGPWGASSAFKIEVEGGIKREGLGGFAITNQSFAIPRSMLIPRQVKIKVAEKDHGGQLDLITTNSPLGNGETVNLSDSEPEEEARDGNITVREMENGVLSISQHSESPLDLDSEMQVDQTPDQTDLGSVALTLSNGDATNEDHSTTLMEVETSHPLKVVPQCQGPITIDGEQHRWALRDHWLYCQTGTWEKKEGMEEASRPEGDGKTQDEEKREQLIHTIHEFLESFYIKYGGFIPLSEADVLEYLKKKGNCDLGNRGLDIKGEMSRYRAALASAPVAGFMVTYNKHTLSLEDLGTLEEQNWLNDQIINMYGELIMEATQHKVHFFNSFFHKQLVAKGYEGVKRWTKKVDLFSKWLLLFPIHLEIHWSLITVTMATKTISYYDSQGIVFRHTTDNILKYLLSEAREKKQTAFQRGWKITIIKGIPQQKNDSDCGVFVLEYCRCLSVRQPLQFSQEDMPRIRKRIYKELCDCHLTK